MKLRNQYYQCAVSSVENRIMPRQYYINDYHYKKELSSDHTVNLTKNFKSVDNFKAFTQQEKLSHLLMSNFSINCPNSMKRVTPSAGNFHPYEIYIITTDFENHVAQCAWYYDPYKHQIQSLHNHLNVKLDKNEMILLISAYPFLSASKYGKRAFRFTEIDIGHLRTQIFNYAKIHAVNIQSLTSKDFDFFWKPILPSLSEKPLEEAKLCFLISETQRNRV